MYKSFTYLTQSRETTYQPTVFLISLPSCLKTGLTWAYSNAVGTVGLDNELLKL